MFGAHPTGEPEDNGRPDLPDTIDSSQRSAHSRSATSSRKRLAACAAAVVVVAGVVVAASVLSSGNGSDGNVSAAAGTTAASPPVSAVTMTRADGSTYEFTDFTVTCESSGEGSQELVIQSPIVSADGEALDEPFLRISIQMDKLQLKRAYPLPVTEKQSSKRPLSVFVSDSGDVATHNEASGAQSSASGKVTFTAAACGETPTVDVQVSGELGSEVKQANIAVEGQVSGP